MAPEGVAYFSYSALPGGYLRNVSCDRVRESGVYCVIHSWDMSDAAVGEFAPRSRRA